jgi:arginyl-tRNA synthetase
MPPGIILKSDGATTYFTRDLATVRYRLDTWDPDIFIYEVGVEQKLHFRQVFEASRLVGWVTDQEMVHIPHGHYRFEGKRISTRKGAEIMLEDILNESVARARKILEESETSKNLEDKEKEEIARAVGIGAIKYFDLNHRPTSQIDFSWEDMFTLHGNSGPYLQYTYARCQSVLKKTAGGEVKENPKIIGDLSDEELNLMRTFTHFQDVLEGVVKNYSPNTLCNYLFDLAQKYNNFYNSHKVIGSDQEEFRLTLTAATAQILANGLKLLGIQAPERM